jgi:O-antigen/teichoic acid export membrane protein
MVSLSDKAAVLIGASTLKYAFGFILPMVLVRLLSQQEYGTYQQLALIANAASGVMVLGIPLSIYYFYHRAHRPTLIAQSQGVLLLCGLLTGLTLALAAPLLAARMHNPRLGELLPVYCAYVGLLIAGEHFIHVMISQDRYATAVTLEIAETLFRVVGIVLVLALGYALNAIAWVLVVYAAVRLLVRSCWLWTGADRIQRARWDERCAGAQLSYGVPLMASTCVGVLGGMMDRAIVAAVFLPAQYAIYSVGALEIPLDTIFQGSVANVLRAALPALVREGRLDEVARIWRDSVRKLALVMIPSFLFLLFFADRLITTLFTQHYEASVRVFQLYVLAVPLYMFILNAIPQVFGRTKLNLYVVLVGVAANALLSLALLRVIGLLGPATAFVCSSYLTSALYLAITARLLETTVRRLLPLAALVRTALAAGLATAPAVLVSSATEGMLALVSGGIVFGLAYLLCGHLVNVFSPADIETARSWIRRVVPMVS